MSTPFQLLPTPGALTWADAPAASESAIGPVWSPWPAPTIAALCRSNVWPAPAVYQITWWAPPSIVHLAPADDIVAPAPSLLARLCTRLASAWQRLRA